MDKENKAVGLSDEELSGASGGLCGSVATVSGDRHGHRR